MKEHVNFYENIKEAYIRLCHTVVTYDRKPYLVLCIADHKNDGIFRIYLDDMTHPKGLAIGRLPGIPYELQDTDPSFKNRGKAMDAFLDSNPDCGIIRKHMNSPLFNKYRPFPLGMCNYQGEVFFVSRRPTRPATQQGLTGNMMVCDKVCFSSKGQGYSRAGVPLTCYEFGQTIMGDYPSPDECWSNMQDPSIINSSVAFSRDFAFVRGPLGILFLAYRSDIVGYLPDKGKKVLNISSEFSYTREAINDLNFFNEINVVN